MEYFPQQATDDPATLYFRNNPHAKLWAIYTMRRSNEESRSAEGGETEEEAADKAVEKEKEKAVALLPKFESVQGPPPRTNTIQAWQHEGEFIYNVKVSSVIDKVSLVMINY